jgi:hypothetical protein
MRPDVPVKGWAVVLSQPPALPSGNSIHRFTSSRQTEGNQVLSEGAPGPGVPQHAADAD